MRALLIRCIHLLDQVLKSWPIRADFSCRIVLKNSTLSKLQFWLLWRTIASKTFAMHEVRSTAIRERRIKSEPMPISITVSGGIAALDDGDDEIAWVANADRALYRAKRSGRNAIKVA